MHAEICNMSSGWTYLSYDRHYSGGDLLHKVQGQCSSLASVEKIKCSIQGQHGGWNDGMTQ